MLVIGRISAALAITSLMTIPASAQAQRPAPQLPMSDMDQKMVKAPMSDMDKRMVKNCKAMPATKMTSDPECQTYLKNHPDWMKGPERRP
jgi:hypothetical protein